MGAGFKMAENSFYEMQKKVCEEKFQNIHKAFTQLRELLKIEEQYKSDSLKEALKNLKDAIYEDKQRFVEIEKNIDDLIIRIDKTNTKFDNFISHCKQKVAYIIGVAFGVWIVLAWLWKAAPKIIKFISTL